MSWQDNLKDNLYGSVVDWEKRFVRFLINHGVYGKYMNNIVQEHSWEDIMESDRWGWVDSYFTWSHTEEGYKFWNSIDDEWKGIVI